MYRFALVVLLVLIARPVAAQEDYRVLYPEGAYAITVCATRAITWTSGETPDSLRAMVAVHEADHVQFMRRFRSCEEFKHFQGASLNNRVAVEASAFCAGARYDFKMGKFPTLSEAIWHHAGSLRWYFGLTHSEASFAIEKWCRQ